MHIHIGAYVYGHIIREALFGSKSLGVDGIVSHYVRLTLPDIAFV